MISRFNLTERIAESEENFSKIKDSIPESVIAYAREIYIDLCKLAEHDLGRMLNYKTLRLGEPYIIYDVEKKDRQDAVFYFPLRVGSMSI